MSQDWARDAVFYHIYPLGLCGAPARNDLAASPVARLERVHEWIPHLQQLGVTALYLGPLFESSSHGYDTADYFWVDRRLGAEETLAGLCDALHAAGIRVILDGVFHHVGREFWAFRDVRERGAASPYSGWFSGLRFDRGGPAGDDFSYDCWNGDHALVKLDTDHQEVRDHLLEAVSSWIQRFDIDGLRLDVADCLDRGFQRVLAQRCRSLKSDFWVMGEVVHGDYRQWTGPEAIDSVTNYDAHKGLYSSLLARNCFEIAHNLDRQFGPHGLYRDLSLYNFADNHDVTRVASRFEEGALLYPLYGLLFTMPGIPSVYYGSEWGLRGEKNGSGDAALRPALELQAAHSVPHPDLASSIARFAELRHHHVALRRGDYQTLHIAAEQLAFTRAHPEERVAVMINASSEAAILEPELRGWEDASLVDLLAPENRYQVEGGQLGPVEVPPRWLRVLRAER